MNDIKILLILFFSFPTIFFLFRQLYTPNEKKLPDLPKNFKLDEKNIKEALAKGYTLKQIHKGLDEPIGSIIKSTNKYIKGCLIFLFLLILIMIASLLILLFL